MRKPMSLNKKIINAVRQRLKLGQKKYGGDIKHNDPRDWLSESAEEMLDGVVYLCAQHFRMLASRDYYVVKMQQVKEAMNWISENSKCPESKRRAKTWIDNFENYE